MSGESKKAYPGRCETSYTRTNNGDTHVVRLSRYEIRVLTPRGSYVPSFFVVVYIQPSDINHHMYTCTTS